MKKLAFLTLTILSVASYDLALAVDVDVDDWCTAANGGNTAKTAIYAHKCLCMPANNTTCYFSSVQNAYKLQKISCDCLN